MLAQNLRKNAHLLLSLFVAAGFAFLLAELLILNHTSGPRLIGVVTCVLGVIFSLVALAPNARVRQILAILFVLFDVEVIFLYPWAVNFRELGFIGLWKMLLFMGTLLIGFFYIIKKKALDWE